MLCALVRLFGLIAHLSPNIILSLIVICVVSSGAIIDHECKSEGQKFFGSTQADRGDAVTWF